MPEKKKMPRSAKDAEAAHRDALGHVEIEDIVCIHQCAPRLIVD
jgi:hypothetical protein